MARLLICLTLFIATIGVFSQAGQVSNSAPSPAPDCSTIVYDMTDCIDFISAGSNATAPSKLCCGGVKSVIAVSPDCLCAAMVTAESIGVKVDKARAKVLPGDCKVPASAYHDCGSSPSPSPAPVNPPHGPSPKPAPPTKPPSPPSKPPPTPASPSGRNTEAPAPATNSGAHSFGLSSFFMGLALSASFILA